MVKSRIVVYTDRFKAEHGKCPRGYGDWYFKCKNSSGKVYEFNHLGMYKEAKDKAVEFACEHGCCVVLLLS